MTAISPLPATRNAVNERYGLLAPADVELPSGKLLNITRSVGQSLEPRRFAWALKGACILYLDGSGVTALPSWPRVEVLAQIEAVR